MKAKFIITLMIVCFLGNLNGITTGSGASSLVFDGMGSRSLGLNEAAVAIGSGAEAISANPALIYSIEKLSLSFMYLKWFFDMNYIYFAGALPSPVKSFGGAFGLSFTRFGSSEFDKYTEESSSPNSTSANDYNISLSYARVIEANLSAGISLKFVNSTLDEYSSTAFAIDIGLLYNLEKDMKLPILLAAAVQNLGTSLKFISETSPLPLNIKAGVGYNLLFAKNHNLMVNAEVNFPNDGEMIFRTGLEYSLIKKVTGLKLLSVRCGVQPVGRKNNLFTLGVGSELPLSQYVKDYQFSVDYALLPVGELGFTHSISVSIIFKEDVAKLFGLEASTENEKSGKKDENLGNKNEM